MPSISRPPAPVSSARIGTRRSGPNSTPIRSGCFRRASFAGWSGKSSGLRLSWGG